MQDDSAEKSQEPTQKKIDDARRKGDVPQSRDLNSAAAYLGLILALAAFGPQLSNDIGTALMHFVANPEGIISTHEETVLEVPFRGMMTAIAPSLLIMFGIPAVMVVVSLIAQSSVTFAGEKLRPKLNRISPINGLKQKFGVVGLVEWIKSLVKLTLFSAILGLLFYFNVGEITVLSQFDPKTSLLFLSDILLQILLLIFVVSAAIGAVDFIFQRHNHLRKLRMSLKELQDETKESEGDPFMKRERRRRGEEHAFNQSMRDVESADVIITNPTHYAVALRWSRKAGSAPECVCKGVDHIAASIRELAEEHNIPIYADPPTARAIYASTDIGSEVSPDLYKAVAAAINFADAIRKRSKAVGL